MPLAGRQNHQIVIVHLNSSSNPVLPPNLLRLFVTLEAERNSNYIFKPLFESWFLEPAGEVAERNAGERSSRLRILPCVRPLWWWIDSLKGEALTRGLFAARTALLCRHSSGEDRKCTTRMGTLRSFARAVQYALVSAFALVLSTRVSLSEHREIGAQRVRRRIEHDSPTATDFFASRSSRATFRHFGR